MRRLATGSPTLDLLGQLDASCAAVSSLCRPTSARKQLAQAVRRADDGRRLRHHGSGGLGDGLCLVGALGGPDLDPDRLQLPLGYSGLVIGQIVLERKGFELGRLEEAAFLGALYEDARRLRLEKLSHLVLGQERFTNPFISSAAGTTVTNTLKRSHCRGKFLAAPGVKLTRPLPSLSAGGAETTFQTKGSLLTPIPPPLVLRFARQVCPRGGKSNSTFPSSFKTSLARKGLPAFERKPGQNLAGLPFLEQLARHLRGERAALQPVSRSQNPQARLLAALPASCSHRRVRFSRIVSPQRGRSLGPGSTRAPGGAAPCRARRSA